MKEREWHSIISVALDYRVWQYLGFLPCTAVSVNVDYWHIIRKYT